MEYFHHGSIELNGSNGNKGGFKEMKNANIHNFEIIGSANNLVERVY